MRCGPEASRARRPATARAGEGGATLVGVMAAGVVLGALALCLMNLWAVFDRMSFDLLLRQKAVFVLNGEMERLSSLYAVTGFGAETRTDSTGYPAAPGLTGADARLVYGTTGAAAGFTRSAVADFDDWDGNVWVQGTGASARNYVWLDAGRDLAARLSWIECEVTTAVAVDCWDMTGGKKPKKMKPGANSPYSCREFNGGPGGEYCRMVTLVLEYPFRLSGTAVAAAGGGRTLTLSTVVGQRRT